MKFTVAYHPYYFSISNHDNHESTWFQKSLNKYNQFDLQHIDDVPPGSKYVVVLDSNADFFWKSLKRHNDLYGWLLCDQRMSQAHSDLHLNHVFPMPVRIWNDSAKGLVHWVVIQSTEGWVEDQIDVAKMQSALNCSENLTFVTAAELDPKYTNLKKHITDTFGINIVHWNHLKEFILWGNGELYDGFLNRKMFDIQTKKNLPYKSICYNRMPRFHRVAIVAHILNRGWHDECIFSLGKTQVRDFSTHLYEEDDRFEYLRNQFGYLKGLNEDIKPQVDTTIDLEFNHAVTLNTNDALHSSFHVVTETVYNTNTYLTEKSYKPFGMLQPFIQFGNQYNVQALRDQGYKTFDKFINHEYDNIWDEKERMLAFLKEFDRLQSISSKDWANMLYEMRHDLMHNFGLVASSYPFNPMVELTDVLVDFYLKD